MTYQPPQDPWHPVPPPLPPPPSPWQPNAQVVPVLPYPTAQTPAAGRHEVHGWATVPVGVNGAPGKGPKRRVTRGQKIAGGILGLFLLCCCGGGLAAIGSSGDDKPAAKESAAAARALAEPAVSQPESPMPSIESPNVAPTTSRPSPAPKPTRNSPKPAPKRTTSAPRTTKPATTRKCDPNYSGCVPIASDVDCAGGSGNGPAYVQGPVRVIATDIYRLDADGDGIACDK
ncbi:hypothetical protein [Micromonospora sp. CB01531]|uniref:hypothetical protein n=1 Tax=Micromonospora sp. CB01531 TaxID=1718947 RepID=UPI0018E99DA9|nr:hypothetical protein [Micromonospora sp. CB01531]